MDTWNEGKPSVEINSVCHLKSAFVRIVFCVEEPELMTPSN